MPLEIIKNCPICSASNFAKYITAKDYTVTHQEFNIQECSECHFLFTNPRPDSNTIGDYYQSKEYISHHDDTTTPISSVYKLVRNFTISQKLQMIEQMKPEKGSILDIGCGTGNFISAFKKNGWNVSGTEPDPEARNVATNRLGSMVYESINNEELLNKQFDIISLWHVLEHVHQLNETIEWVKNHLKPGGKIIIAVPNPESYDAKKYGRFWAALDVPRHLYHFTKDSMKLLSNRHGLYVEDIKPMWFDSFYVSMLSTKYKRSNLIESVKTGLLSNIKGRRKKNRPINTSSLIYILVNH